MSLSIPTTVNPLLANCRAASAPIKPAEPVITATLILLRKDWFELRALIDQPAPDILVKLIERTLRRPVGHPCYALTIADVKWNIGIPRFGDMPTLDRPTGELLTHRG